MATQLKFRNATGTPAAGTDPTPTPAPVQTRAEPTPAPAPAVHRTSAELAAERGRLIAEAEQLQTRSATTPLTPDEDGRLDQCIAEAERLEGEIGRVRREERLAHQRSTLAQPTRPAPQFTPAQRSTGPAGDAQAEGLKTWLLSFGPDADRSPDASYRAQQGGFVIGASAARVDVDYRGTLNRTKRRAMSTGGSGTGAELIPQTYSGKVTEYITYFSPVVGAVDSEVTDDGNSRDYFRFDDTALMSTYTTASSGTEIAPTIPDKDVTTGSVTINVFDITSGYHKLTRQVLRDSAVTITDKVTKAIGNSHARRIEYDVVNGTGNGTTGIQGLIAAAAVYGGAAVDAFTPDLFESVYFSVPQQYRAGCVWLFSDTSMAKAVNKMKDTTGRSLFGKTMAEGAEIRTLFERPCYTSAHMPAYGANAKSVLFFNPMFYMLRLVRGQTIDVLREKFYPNLAYAGGMSFGGAWLGPAAAIKCIQSDATPDSGS